MQDTWANNSLQGTLKSDTKRDKTGVKTRNVQE